MRWDTPTGLDVRLADGVLDVVLDRSERGNSLDHEMVVGLNSVVEAAGADEAVRVLVLRGAGDDFCTGVVSPPDAAPQEGAPAGPRPRVGTLTRRLPFESHRLVTSLMSLQTPVVAAVRGRAHHVGLALALAADVTIVATDADLRAGFVSRAVTPDAGLTWMVPRRVGEVRARELLLLDRTLDGEAAAAWGMVHEAVPPAELDAAVGRVVERLGAAATVALGLTKWLAHRGRAAHLEDQLRDEAFGLELSARSEDFREGLAALRDRRPPDFKGR